MKSFVKPRFLGRSLTNYLWSSALICVHLRLKKMSDYYQKNYNAYHEKTFSIDPTSFLAPLAQRLPAEAFVLDVGCGSGRDLLWMKKRGFDVIGFERSPGLAELARDNVGCEVIQGDFETYDFSSIVSRVFHELILP